MKLKSALTEMRTAWEYDISQLQSAISGISVARKKESAVFLEELKSAHRERRRALNNLLELRGNIRVLCRVRPISLSPSSEALQEAAETASGSTTTRYEDPASSFMGPHGGTPGVVVDTDGMTIRVTSSKTGLERSWRFPRVFPLDVTQSEVFEEIEPMIHAVLDGYNATIFAYGQVRKSPSRNEQIFPFSDRSHLLMFQTHISLHNSRLELERPTPCRGTFRHHRRRLWEQKKECNLEHCGCFSRNAKKHQLPQSVGLIQKFNGNYGFLLWKFTWIVSVTFSIIIMARRKRRS